jgi:predicted nucleic acid-binding protein
LRSGSHAARIVASQLDALHIAVAVRVATDEFITYDLRQAEAAQSVGLTLVRP